MILIWGFRVRSKRLGDGTFACPRCGVDRAFTRQEVRRWFTLFFIPLIPLKVLGELIECDTCHGKFDPQVLSAPTASHLEEQLLAAMREGVVAILGSDPTPTARAEAVALLSSFAGRTWTDADLEADLLQCDPGHLPARLATLATVLTEQGKERIVGGLAQVAATGGVLGASERARIQEIAGAVGMTAAHARGVIDSTIETV